MGTPALRPCVTHGLTLLQCLALRAPTGHLDTKQASDRASAGQGMLGDQWDRKLETTRFNR